MPRWKDASVDLHRQKREAVLREATRIIARRGYHATSLDDVAEALHVSKGTLYNYVKDKQEILFECHKMALDVGDSAFRFAEESSATGYGRLRHFFRAYLTWLHGEVGARGLVTDLTALRPADQRAVIARRDAVEAKLVRYFEQGFADGTVEPVDAKLAVFTIMGAINAVNTWFDPNGRLAIDEVASSMVDLLLRGICGKHPTKSPFVDRPIPPLD